MEILSIHVTRDGIINKVHIQNLKLVPENAPVRLVQVEDNGRPVGHKIGAKKSDQKSNLIIIMD